ncbi:MAG: NAD(P)H-hydrate dehydratase [bacterium]|nr:NAD(P)H-hydrate dehydratase [bacterium]
MSASPEILSYLKQLRLPADDSHKGQNGKLLLIGGSELFHAASKWSLDIASQIVDMVFYSSVPGNNELIKEAKGNFWNGIVIERADIDQYAQEADCILIGPGMIRSQETADVTNQILRHYRDKRIVLDAGALQMLDPSLLHKNCILTPHARELERVLSKIDDDSEVAMQKLLQKEVLVVLKNQQDTISTLDKELIVTGGNAGMTKGGTGDVLAGLIAALYCTHDQWTAAVAGSYFNKRAGDELYQEVGPYFNATQLAAQLPKTIWRELQSL